MDDVDPERRRDEDDLLQIFVDISAVFGRQAAPEAGEAGGALSAEEYLFTYLRTLEAQGGDLPRGFVDKLQRALAHYGVESLEPTPALRESLLWMFKSRRRADQQVDAVVAVLEQRLARGDARRVAGFPAAARPPDRGVAQPLPGGVGPRARRPVSRLRSARLRGSPAAPSTRRWRRTSPRWRATRTAPTAARGSRRWSRARSRSRSCSRRGSSRPRRWFAR